MGSIPGATYTRVAAVHPYIYGLGDRLSLGKTKGSHSSPLILGEWHTWGYDRQE